MAIEAVLLDLGNVVLNLDFRRMLGAVGLPRPGSEKSAMEGLDGLAIYDRFERGTVTEAEFFKAIHSKLVRPLSFDAFERAWNEIFLGEVDGIDQTLQAIAARIPLYGLSNVNSLHMRRILQFPALRHFKKIFTSFELQCRKPEPECFQKTADAMGLPLQRILFMDDRLENVEGGRRLGMPSELVAHSSQGILDHLSRHGIVVE